MGRPVGSKNKVAQSTKANIEAVFVRMGSTAGMFKWAQANPTEFYKIYARLLPVDIDVNIRPCDVSSEPLSKDEWDKLYGNHLAPPVRAPDRTN